MNALKRCDLLEGMARYIYMEGLALHGNYSAFCVEA